ncbi:E3 ubiquitin-protein ligase ZNF598/Hel2 like protein [Babesia gibsoni]|uniref:E3 ubiquitin-protein ligase ZNF598/Hel2 like protein n=1 Tax=Babesia gibsoni TaxID=33632 RepID=A0AAD8LSY2_BABGI|nr:E3 ubiquitin-protein ligase ZNF598/Hel2 like protein [Babesia gibsoni]
MGFGRRQVGERNGSSTAAANDHRVLPLDSMEIYTLFPTGLQDLILDAFVESGVSRRKCLSREQILEVTKLPVSEHFHNYLCCCICYENALICAVGSCSHLMCFLCVMRLMHFYEDECDVYMCPYCKQESDCLIICANPFFAHRCVQPLLYSGNGAYEMSKSNLTDMLSIMSLDAKVNRILLLQGDVNIKDIQETFLESVRGVKKRSHISSNMNMQELTQQIKKLSLEKPNKAATFNEVYLKRHSNPRFDDGFVYVKEHRLLFEHPGMYMLFRVVTSPLCWMPECRSSWYTPMPIATTQDLKKAIDKIYKHRSTSFKSLNNHIKGRHGAVFCETCLAHLSEKKFICEMALYTPAEIGNHIKLGDPDRVPPVPSHVLCTACGKYQWDRAELKRHAKSDHFFCNVCDAEGWVFDIFEDYPSIFHHFKTYHYPCEEEDCIFVVFRDDLQLQLHYMSKHPQKHRSPLSRKSKPQLPSQPPEVEKLHSTSYTHDISLLNTSEWDGTIKIIPDTVSVTEHAEIKEEVDKVSAEYAEWLTKHAYLTDPELKGFNKINDLLEAFSKELIRVNFGSDRYVFDFDTFNVRLAMRVLNDLKRVYELAKDGLYPPDCELWRLIPMDFHEHCHGVIKKMESDYKCFVEASLAQESTIPEDESGEKPKSLLDIVKDAVSHLAVVLYSINFHTEFGTIIRLVKETSEEYKASPNALMLLNMLHSMISKTNKILVKQSLDWLVKAMETAINKTNDTDQSSTSLTAIVKKKTKLKGDFHIDMLNPGSDLAKEIYQDKRMKRMQKNAAVQPNKTGWNIKQKEKEPQEAATPVVTPQTQESKTEEETPPSPFVENDSYVKSLEEEFKTHSYSNFYEALKSVISSVLKANEAKYHASAAGYHLRETTKLKIKQLMTSGIRRLTLLSQFVPMKFLESLQALEPEFYRLLKEARSGENMDPLAKTWCSRCSYVLRRCRVEYLEVIDYYLHAEAPAMAIGNDAEFPSLGGNGVPQTSRRRRNYAEALNVPSNSRVVFTESDFPALG